MENQETLLKLFKELEPLKVALTHEFNLSHIGLDRDDVMGFMDEKIIHVFLHYPDKPYEELKGIAIASLYRVIPRLYRKYGREVLMEESHFISTPEESHPSITHLLEELKGLLDPLQFQLAQVILDPPLYVLSKVKDPFGKIPSKYFLEFLGIPTDKYHLKKANAFRRSLFKFIRKNFDPQTFSLIST